MTHDEMERLECTTLLMVVQALKDYRTAAVKIFQEEADLPQDIAEDVTREAIESMSMAGFGERLYGKVDFKKAIYVFMPDVQPVALMLDAKAEKKNGDRTATIQMSQTSMRVRMHRSGAMWNSRIASAVRGRQPLRGPPLRYGPPGDTPGPLRLRRRLGPKGSLPAR